MPIYQQTYRSFDGEVVRNFRWMAMVSQEWRIIRKRWFFWVLCVPTIIMFVLLAGYIYLVDMAASFRNHPLAEVAQSLPIQKVDNDLFFLFIRFQIPLIFIISLYVGSGFISKDFRFNLVDIYFSKPLSWMDYVLGKVMTLMFIGFGLTVLPVCILLVVHFIFSPSLDTIRETYWIPFAALGFATVITLPCALAVLASSSFFNSQMFAAIAVFMVAIVNGAFGSVMALMLDKQSFLVLAFPIATNRLGEAIFRQANLNLVVNPYVSGVFWVVVCVLALLVVCAKVRKAGAVS